MAGDSSRSRHSRRRFAGSPERAPRARSGGRAKGPTDSDRFESCGDNLDKSKNYQKRFTISENALGRSDWESALSVMARLLWLERAQAKKRRNEMRLNPLKTKGGFLEMVESACLMISMKLRPRCETFRFVWRNDSFRLRCFCPLRRAKRNERAWLKESLGPPNNRRRRRGPPERA